MKSLHDAPSTPHHPPRMQARLVVGMLASALIAAGCTKEAPTAPSAAGQRPAVEVGTVTATPGDVGLVTELPGRVEASRVAQVRARAAGILQQRMFKEGSDVKADKPCSVSMKPPTRRPWTAPRPTKPRQKPTWHKRKRSWNGTVRWSKPMRSASKISSTQRLQSNNPRQT
mgnify:CR=1 FL=1